MPLHGRGPLRPRTGALRMLLCLTLLFCLGTTAGFAQSRSDDSSNRWLILVETSRAMRSRLPGVARAVGGLLDSGMKDQLRSGDTLGVWTFNQSLYAGQFPLKEWAPEGQKDISSNVVAFLKGQTYRNQARFDQVLAPLTSVVRESSLITVVLFSSGEQPVQGTPFDTSINGFFKTWRDQQQKARMPFVVVLRARHGKWTDCTMNSAPWPVEIPKLPPPEPPPASVVSQPPPQPAPPPMLPPLILSGRKASLPPAPKPAEAAQAVPPTPITPATPASVPAPAVVAPPQLSATDSSQGNAASPPKPDVPGPPAKTATLPAAPAANSAPVAADPIRPAQIASDSPATSVPALPSAHPSASPSSEVAVAEGDRTPAKPARDQGPSSSPSASATVPPPQAQNAAAVPAAGAGRFGSWWIGAAVAGGAILVLMVVLWRRSRGSPQASLITRSLEREGK